MPIATQQSIESPGLVARAWYRVTARPVSIALICVAALSATNASASEYASRDVGGWTVTPSKDGKGCFLIKEYERNGGTTVLLGLDTDGTNRLSVLNPNWSIKPKDRLKLDFRLSHSSYPAHFAVGIASAGKRGFVTSFGEKFPAYFAASKALNISRGPVPVERLSLDADAAVVELRKCVAGQRAKTSVGGDGQERADHIPRDPFAPASGRRKSER